MIYCKYLNKNFKTKEHRFEAMLSDRDKIINRKKSKLKKTKSTYLSVQKEFNLNPQFKTEPGHFYPIINTTNVFDSHDDVHIDGIWDDYLNKGGNDVSYVMDHDLSVKSLIVHSSKVEIFKHETTFKNLGYNVDGKTTALMFKLKEDDVFNSEAFIFINNKMQAENSVRMRYDEMKIAIKSNDPDFKEENSLFEKHIEGVANKDAAIKNGYFFAITKASIMYEGSLVLKGSNGITNIIYHQESEDQGFFDNW